MPEVASVPDQPTHRFRLLGLNPAGRYRVRFQDQGKAAERWLTGQVLMQEGVEVALPWPQSSELVFLDESR